MHIFAGGRAFPGDALPACCQTPTLHLSRAKENRHEHPQPALPALAPAAGFRRHPQRSAAAGPARRPAADRSSRRRYRADSHHRRYARSCQHHDYPHQCRSHPRRYSGNLHQQLPGEAAVGTRHRRRTLVRTRRPRPRPGAFPPPPRGRTGGAALAQRNPGQPRRRPARAAGPEHHPGPGPSRAGHRPRTPRVLQRGACPAGRRRAGRTDRAGGPGRWLPCRSAGPAG